MYCVYSKAFVVAIRILAKMGRKRLPTLEADCSDDEPPVQVKTAPKRKKLAQSVAASSSHAEEPPMDEHDDTIEKDKAAE